jgi:hypothetical protein
MILNDLFESSMSELDIEYQDYKNLEPVAFYSRYKMTKDEWAGKHWSLIKGSETVHEGAVKNLHTELEEKYRELAPSIEKYKDSFLAGQLYDALEAIAIEHGAELEFKRMMNGARNRAHMDYDTNPGGFQNWFWYLPFANNEADGVLESAREKWNRASAEREKKHADAEKEMKARHARGEEDMKGSIDRLEKALAKPVAENQSTSIPFDQCPNCGGSIVHESQITEKQDACYHKVKSRYKVWPSAYASGALVQCRKKGAANWGNKTKK